MDLLFGKEDGEIMPYLIPYPTSVLLKMDLLPRRKLETPDY